MGYKKREQNVLWRLNEQTGDLYGCKCSASRLHGNLRDFLRGNIFLTVAANRDTKIESPRLDGWLEETLQ